MSSISPRTRPSPSEADRQRDMTGPVGVLIVASGAAGLLAAAAVTGSSVSPLVWYLGRAAGFTLYLLLWLSVVTGLGLTTKLLDLIVRRQETWVLHRVTTELAIVFLVLHLLVLAIDPTVALGLAGVLLPFVSDVRQPWTDIGIMTGWGMVGIALSFSLRRVLRQRGWRLLHYAAFPLWIMALMHGFGAGSDSGHLWARFLYTSTSAVVLFLILFRLLMAVFHWRPAIASSRESGASLKRDQVTDAG